MDRVTYHVVTHDEGFAYRLGDVYSEPFPTHDEALSAARAAASAQQLSGSDAEISWQDANGDWKFEHADGADRPMASVVDDVEDAR
ncbi:DUF2188 domain-containing protein [Peteryoungia ipomoeae]|uniref:DUF2188 domain-containing protein n=1 Tax=Peteryoungia ipomoeae TaxID=1210932 RepID=A0A4S8P2Y9_9HYPH|nr:DUF2188 domain-containing protein [Peteryoungia ipomoeae]THV23172.1 DUF2188 domain-containing protein [Peteryoungia ipomoeae]